MFVSFLLPYVDRGQGPIFHWLMFKQLASFGTEEFAFLGDDRYFECGDAPWGQPLDQFGFRYDCPTEDELDDVLKYPVPESVLESLDEDSGSMLDAFRLLLTEEYPPLSDYISETLTELQEAGKVDAVMSWCNVPSLEKVAKEAGIPVIHNELGPLRGPYYHGTAYFDFNGVNGGTSGEKEVAQFVEAAPQWNGFRPLGLKEIRELLCRQEDDCGQSETIDYPVGVALQVEDDSNLICFANGHSNLDAIFRARKGRSLDEVLIRQHPSGHMVYSDKLGVIDHSSNSRAFIDRCAEIVTVNSSVAYEAILRGKPVTILGDTAAAPFSKERELAQDPEAFLLGVNYLFLVHLIPQKLLFEPEYTRWRLTNPGLKEIYGRHLAFWAGEIVERDGVKPKVEAKVLESKPTIPNHPIVVTPTLGTSRSGLKDAPTPPAAMSLGKGRGDWVKELSRKVGAIDLLERKERVGGQVLFVSHDASRTGAPLLLLRFLRWLKANAVMDFRVLLRSGGPLEAEFKEIAETRVAGELTDPEAFLKDVALVYSNTCTNGEYLQTLPLNNVPVLTHVHELSYVIDWFGLESFEKTRKQTDQFIACSQIVKEGLMDQHAIDADQTELIYEWVPVDEVEEKALTVPPDEFRAANGIDTDCFVVVACGGTEWRKGPDLFVQLADAVHRRVKGHSKVAFVWVGQVHEDERGRILRHDVRQLGLSDVVRFVGEQENPYPWLNCADVFCLTSREDPFPVVMLEAGALGKPVICFEGGGGAVEYCANGGGFAVPYLNVDAMAQRVFGLIRNRELLGEIGAAGAKLVRERYDLAKTGPQILALIDRWLDDPGEEDGSDASERLPSREPNLIPTPVPQDRQRTDEEAIPPSAARIQSSHVLERAESLFTAGDLEGAEQELRRLVESGDHSPGVILALGNVLFEAGDILEAHRHLVWATALDPNSLPAHVNLGLLLVQMDRLETAEGAMRRALELDSRHLGAMRVMGRLCMRGSRYSEAAEHFECLLKLVGEDQDALLNLIRCRLEQRHLTLAEILCEEALENFPDDKNAKKLAKEIEEAKERFQVKPAPALEQ